MTKLSKLGLIAPPAIAAASLLAWGMWDTKHQSLSTRAKVSSGRARP